MFGMFEAPHTSIGWSGGAGGGAGVVAGPPAGGGGGLIPAGGFPGIFPAGGVSNSGWAGINDLNYQQWKKDCVKKGTCVMGPPAALMGPRRI